MTEMLYHGRIMPFGDNNLIPAGVGPLTLRDAYYNLVIPTVPPPLPCGFWLAVTVVSLSGQYILVRRIIKFLIDVWGRRTGFTIDASDAGPLMALMTTLIYCSPIILIHLVDRYCLPLLPLVFYWLLATGKPLRAPNLAAALAGVIGVVTILYSILGVHDYMTWNRARWEGIAQLERTNKADYRNLDGGFEYNGLRGFDPAYKIDYSPHAEKSWWWVKDDEFVIAFAPFGQYAPVARYDYQTLLPPATRSIYVLQRRSTSQSNSR
jgi:hypothetical protein